jgi:hypothetical protein
MHIVFHSGQPVSRVDSVTDREGNVLCHTSERHPTSSQRLGYTGLIRSGYSPDRLSSWAFGPSKGRRFWSRLCAHASAVIERPSAEPIPDDEANTRAKSIMADLNRISRRYGRHAEDVAQESFRLVWEGLNSGDPPSWIDLDDYKGTLRRAVRRARQLVVFRHVPPPLHRLLALQAPPESTLHDGPKECFEALSRMVPDMPSREAALLAFAGSLGFDRHDTPAEKWEVMAEIISESEGKATVITKSTVERRLSLARVFVVLGSILADSV